MEIQKEIVSQVKDELSIIDRNKKLIEMFEKKISNTIKSVWEG